jgi:hypothetical protein
VVVGIVNPVLPMRTQEVMLAIPQAGQWYHQFPQSANFQRPWSQQLPRITVAFSMLSSADSVLRAKESR